MCRIIAPLCRGRGGALAVRVGPAGVGRRRVFRAESRTIEILLYTRRGCHLCEAVEDLLPHHAPAARIVDIAGDDRLEAEFGARVPVLVIDGGVAAEGRIDEPTLIIALAARGKSHP